MRRFLMYLVLSLLFTQAIKAKEDNAVLLCENSLETLEMNLEFIKNAKQSVEFSLCFAGGETLRAILDAAGVALTSSHEVTVYFIAEPILMSNEDRELIESYRQYYGDRFHFLYGNGNVTFSPDIAMTQMHVKTLIVDELYFMVGGSNYDDASCTDGSCMVKRKEDATFAQKGLAAGNRDQDIVGRGSTVAKELREAFHELYAVVEHFTQTGIFEKDPAYFKGKSHYWPLRDTRKAFVTSFETHPDLVEGVDVKMFMCAPAYDPNPITTEYGRLIREAKESIEIGNLLFSPDEPVREELLNAVNRGIELTLITNGYGRCSKFFDTVMAWSNRVNYTPLHYGRDFYIWEGSHAARCERRKSRIFEYNVSDVLYHKKVMIVDKRYVVIGSYNLGRRSNKADFEMVVTIDSPLVAEQLHKVLERDKKLSTEVSAEEARGWYFDPTIAYIGAVQKKLHGFT